MTILNAASVTGSTTGSWPSDPSQTLSADGTSWDVPFMGAAISVSGDGNTLIVSGPGSDGQGGGFLVYTLTSDGWTYQSGPHAPASIAGVQTYFGASCAVSHDGNTIVVGAPNFPVDSTPYIGAVWVYTRGTTMSHVMLQAAGGSQPMLGAAVAVSADGNTVLAGAPSAGDSECEGAAWVYQRQSAGDAWPTPTELEPSNVPKLARVGSAVALSADGTVALLGTYDEDSKTPGEAWIFTLAGGTWSETAKLMPNDAVLPTLFGASVALSADGTMAVIGGPGDNNGTGAGWIFASDSTGKWQQSQPKFVGTYSDMPDTPLGQGASVAVSADGSCILIGGNGIPLDSTGVGWVYAQDATGKWQPSGGTVLQGSTDDAEKTGVSVALSPQGDVAFVGSPGAYITIHAGAVYIFDESTST